MDMEPAIPLMPLRRTSTRPASRRTFANLSSKPIDTPVDHKYSSLSFLSLKSLRTVVTSPVVTAFTCASFIGSIMSYSFSRSTASHEQSDSQHTIPCHNNGINSSNNRKSLSNSLKSTMAAPPSMINCASPPCTSLSVIHSISYIMSLNECKSTSSDVMPLAADHPVLPTNNQCSQGHLLNDIQLQQLSLKHTTRQDTLSGISPFMVIHFMTSATQLSDATQTAIITASTYISTNSAPSLMSQLIGNKKAMAIVQINTISAQSNKGSVTTQCVEIDSLLETAKTITNITRQVMNRLRTAL